MNVRWRGRGFLGVVAVFALFAGVAILDVSLQVRTGDAAFSPSEVVGVAARNALIIASSVCFLGRRARWLLMPLWFWVCFVEFLETSTCWLCGSLLDGDWLMIALASSSREILEFLQAVPLVPALVTVACTLTLMLVGCICIARVSMPKPSFASVAVGVVMCLPFLAFNVFLRNPKGLFNDVLYTFMPVDTVWNFRLFSDMASSARSPELPDNLRKLPTSSPPIIGVFVVGESATRSNWGLYGYPRPTTPRMSALQRDGALVVFRDVTAAATTTGKALRFLFTEATLAQPSRAKSSFAAQCADCGYECSLVSMQGGWGRWGTVEPLVFAGCSRRIYPGKVSAVTSYDSAMLPILDSVLAVSTNRPAIVFLHANGSHFKPEDRFPPQYRKFPRSPNDTPPDLPSDAMPPSAVDAYDNSILYFDWILGKIVDCLAALHRPAFMLYISDHGETPRAKWWRAADDPDIRSVPMVLWTSNEFRREFPSVVARMAAVSARPWNADSLMPLFRDLVGIGGDAWTE